MRKMRRYYLHPLLDHLIAVPAFVYAVAVVCRVAADDLALARLAELPAAGSLGRLGPLELGELVQDAVRKLPFGRVVAAVVHGPDLRPALGEFLPQEVEVRRLPSETVPVLGEHDGDTAGGMGARASRA